MADITRKDVERRINRGESLKEIDMTGLNLDDLNFEGSIFYKCKLTGSRINSSNFAFSRFEACLFNECEMQECNLQESSFVECDFSKTDLRDSILIEANFRQTVLHSTDFSGSFLQDVVLIEARGDLCNFSFSTLNESNLNGAIFHVCDLVPATVLESVQLLLTLRALNLGEHGLTRLKFKVLF